jgi:probable addiction module antidote protein
MSYTKPFNAAEFLDTDEDIAAYLCEAFRDGDANVIAAAIGVVARARGI